MFFNLSATYWFLFVLLIKELKLKLYYETVSYLIYIYIFDPKLV